MGTGVPGVVLGRYYIDNWIMGSIHLQDGLLIDTTETSLSHQDCIMRSSRHPHRNEYLLEEVVAKLHFAERLLLQQAHRERGLPVGLVDQGQL